MNKLTTLFFCLLYFNGIAQNAPVSAGKPVYIPSVLINGRFYIKIPTFNGDSILSFCDTGGGYTALYPSTVSKLHLQSKILELNIDGEKTNYIPAKDVINHPDIPLPFIQLYYQKYINTPFFEVPESSKADDFFSSYIPQEAFLGQFFFIGHAWTFNYPEGKILMNTPLARDGKYDNMQPIGFKKNRDGTKRFGHPSMQVEIDGQLIDVLFDTGASILLSKATQAALNVDSKSIGGSFIAKSVFDDWRIKHPDWRFIEKGEVTGADMMQVPLVKVGSLTAGPVWFAKRPDEAWSRGMIGSMDKVVKGAIGGSFFQYFKVTIDYNSELVKFER